MLRSTKHSNCSVQFISVSSVQLVALIVNKFHVVHQEDTWCTHSLSGHRSVLWSLITSVVSHTKQALWWNTGRYMQANLANSVRCSLFNLRHSSRSSVQAITGSDRYCQPSLNVTVKRDLVWSHDAIYRSVSVNKTKALTNAGDFRTN